MNYTEEAKIVENTSETLMTIEEVCSELMIGRNAAYKLLETNELKGFRIGRIWKIPRESIKAYIREQIQKV